MTSEIEQIEAAKEVLEGTIRELYESCSLIVDNYWTVLIQLEKARPGWEHKSKLKLRCGLTGNSIRADWNAVTWRGKKNGKFFDVTKSISKPQGKYGYTLTKLYSYAHEWEKPLIEETEEKLEMIRRESYHLNGALKSIRYALEIAKKREELISTQLAFDSSQRKRMLQSNF
jgi:hypothetical protein